MASRSSSWPTHSGASSASLQEPLDIVRWTYRLNPLRYGTSRSACSKTEGDQNDDQNAPFASA